MSGVSYFSCVLLLLSFLLCSCGAGSPPAENRDGSSNNAAQPPQAMEEEDKRLIPLIQPPAPRETEQAQSKEATAWNLITNEQAYVIDVRSQEEYDAGHLSDAVLMPYDKIGQLIAEKNIAKDRQIVLYCRSGGRAGKAEASLKALGYTSLFNAGGYEALSAAKNAAD